MLSFQNLPAEILFKIAQNVGGAYLRFRVDRILLCKSWYSVTQSVLWDDIDLSIDSFERYLQAAIDTQSFIRSRAKSLSISGTHDNFTITLLPPSETEIDHQETLCLAKHRTLLLARYTTLCNSMTTFSTTLPKMHKLRTFTLKLSSQSTVYTEPDNQNTWTDTLRCLVTSLPKTLTSLTIDKLGQTSRFSTGMRNPHAVCKVVLAKDALPALKHLRLRTHCICPSLFSAKTIESQGNLKTLVVALDAYSPQVGKVYHAHRCTQPQQSSRRLFDDMREAAKVAVEAGCFPSLKKLRILRYDVQELAFYSHDVVSGREVEVSETVEWDDVDWENRSKMDSNVGQTSLDTNELLVGEELDEAVVVIPSAPEIEIPVPTTLTINVAVDG
ncbi:hypothetical protein DL98DRAFT_604223 [Cadophora sp. DSE1049]|nr:hypothetical protein DL98DRAFT_604223 [Cadophora sp. DSE1049]